MHNNLEEYFAKNLNEESKERVLNNIKDINEPLKKAISQLPEQGTWF